MASARSSACCNGRCLGELSKEILGGQVSKDAVKEAVLEDGVVKFENVEMPAV